MLYPFLAMLISVLLYSLYRRAQYWRLGKSTVAQLLAAAALLAGMGSSAIRWSRRMVQ